MVAKSISYNDTDYDNHSQKEYPYDFKFLGRVPIPKAW